MGWLEGGGVEDMPYLRHVVGAKCRENEVPFFRYAVFTVHCRHRGFSPETMCREVRGNESLGLHPCRISK